MNRYKLTDLKKDILLTVNKDNVKKTTDDIIIKYSNDLDELIMRIYIITYFDEFVYLNKDIIKSCSNLLDEIIIRRPEEISQLEFIQSTITSYDERSRIDKVKYTDRAITEYLSDIDSYIESNSKISHEELDEILSSLKVVEEIKNKNLLKKEKNIINFINDRYYNKKLGKILKRTDKLLEKATSRM